MAQAYIFRLTVAANAVTYSQSAKIVTPDTVRCTRMSINTES